MIWIACILFAWMPAAQPSTVTYRLTHQEAGGRPPQESTVKGTADDLLLTIESSSGIGSLRVIPEAGNWSKRITLRLHLRGLESLEIENQKQKLVGNVTSTTPRVVVWRCVEPGTEGRAGESGLLASGDALHPSLIIVPRRPGEPPRIPLDGYFEVVLPRDLLSTATQEITIRWIDFYR